MATSRRASSYNHVIQLSETYVVTKKGNSKALCFLKGLDPQPIPTELGAEYTVQYREEGPDGSPEIALKPVSNE